MTTKISEMGFQDYVWYDWKYAKEKYIHHAKKDKAVNIAVKYWDSVEDEFRVLFFWNCTYTSTDGSWSHLEKGEGYKPVNYDGKIIAFMLSDLPSVKLSEFKIFQYSLSTEIQT